MCDSDETTTTTEEITTTVGDIKVGFSKVDIDTWAVDASSHQINFIFENRAGKQIKITNVNVEGVLTNTAIVMAAGTKSSNFETVDCPSITAGDAFRWDVEISYYIVGYEGTTLKSSGTLSGRASGEFETDGFINCAVANLELATSPVSVGTTDFTVIVSNTGLEDLKYLRVTLFNDTYAETCTPTPTSINKGEVKTLTSSSCGIGGVNKIRVTTTQCPGVKGEITKVSGTWKVTG